MSDERLGVEATESSVGGEVAVRTGLLLAGTGFILLAARPLFRTYSTTTNWDFEDAMLAAYALFGLWLVVVASSVVLLVLSFTSRTAWRTPFRITGAVHALLGLGGCIYAVVEEG